MLHAATQAQIIILYSKQDTTVMLTAQKVLEVKQSGRKHK